MRILVRTSKAAIWARRLATFSLATLVVSIALHMMGQLATDIFETILAIATAIAALGVFLALCAYVKLWISGDRGWGPATFGLLVGGLCLTPAIAVAVLVSNYPSTVDVTTALVSPPELVAAEPAPSLIDPESVLETFPNLITRIYQVPPDILFGMVESEVRNRGWEIVRTRAPQTATGEGVLNARQRSLLGLESEFAMRISPGPLGALIDLRATAFGPVRHDLGENGRAIESFLLALDNTVTVYQQNNLAAEDDEVDFEVVTEDQ
jgi:hypothetical protein